MQKIFVYHDMPTGLITIGELDGMINFVLFADELRFAADFDEVYEVEETSVIGQAKEQLVEYFAGKRKEFALPLLTEGTEFQVRVWDALRSIPYGETRSYKEIAEMIGNPKASRAVGLANNRNPISIMIPCHRVIGINGKMVGYGGGINIKEFLLSLEKENNDK